MNKANLAALEFLQTRRSRPYKTLSHPAPDAAEMDEMLTIAARVPDHGKLEPWRFIILTDAALMRLSKLTHSRGEALKIDPDKLAKAANEFALAPMIVAVISSPKASDKVPMIEQSYSAGAVCLSLLNAALASGWGANWLSGWTCYDTDFLRQGLDLTAGETVAGFVHIGSQTCQPPDRPRPDIGQISDWRSV